jgi:hypothetical protein
VELTVDVPPSPQHFPCWQKEMLPLTGGSEAGDGGLSARLWMHFTAQAVFAVSCLIGKERDRVRDRVRECREQGS